MSETIHTPDIADTTAPIADKGISEEKISALASAINFDDPALTISYGSKTMNEIAKFADDLLGNVRVKDAGPVGDSLQELMLKVKDIDVTEIASPKKSVLSSIPLIGSLFGDHFIRGGKHFARIRIFDLIQRESADQTFAEGFQFTVSVHNCLNNDAFLAAAVIITDNNIL